MGVAVDNRKTLSIYLENNIVEGQLGSHEPDDKCNLIRTSLFYFSMNEEK